MTLNNPLHFLLPLFRLFLVKISFNLCFSFLGGLDKIKHATKEQA